MPRTALLLGLGSLVLISASAVVEAADLALQPAVHHRGGRIVRDYDGTPIVIRPRPDGTADVYAVSRAQPRIYLNGEPVSVRYLVR